MLPSPTSDKAENVFPVGAHTHIQHIYTYIHGSPHSSQSLMVSPVDKHRGTHTYRSSWNSPVLPVAIPSLVSPLEMHAHQLIQQKRNN